MKMFNRVLLAWLASTMFVAGAYGDKVTDLATIPAVADGDLLHIVDVSDTTDDPAGSSFKVAVSDLRGSSTLPADAAGYLENDGSGSLSWSTPAGGGGGSGVVAPKVLIEEITADGTTITEFDFDNIPGDYDRLIIEGPIQSDDSADFDYAHVYINTDTTATNYRRQYGGTVSGASQTGSTNDNRLFNITGATSPSKANARLVIEDYAGSDPKLVEARLVGHWDSGTNLQNLTNAVASSVSAAVTRLRIYAVNGDMTGTLRLYGERSIAVEDSETITVKKAVPVVLSGGEFDIDLTDYQDGDRVIIEGYLRSSASGTGGDVVLAYLNSDTTPGNYHYQTNTGYDGGNVVTDAASARIAVASASGAVSNSNALIRITYEDYAASGLVKIGSSIISAEFGPNKAWSGQETSVSSITDPITRIRIRTDNYGTDDLSGTLKAYIEKEGVLPVMTQLDGDSLPTGTLASPPSGMSVDDLWLDTTDSATHPAVRLSTVGT